MQKVGEEGRGDEGGVAERREGRVAGSVAGASNYSAINNPRVTRVIGPLSLRPPPRRSLARFPSFLATNPKVSMLVVRQRNCPCVSGAFIASRNAHRSIARQGILMRRIATTRVPDCFIRFVADNNFAQNHNDRLYQIVLLTSNLTRLTLIRSITFSKTLALTLSFGFWAAASCESNFT